MNNTTTYAVAEEKAWVREGCSNRAAFVVEHEGFELKITGYRVVRDGVKVFVAYPPFATAEAAFAKIAEMTA